MNFTPEVFYGIGGAVLLAALIWGMIHYNTRNRANDLVTEKATDALYDNPKTYDQKRPSLDADHVTLLGDAPANVDPPDLKTGQVVGEADDRAGLQALVVSIDGTTDRPVGGTYHINWSLSPGRDPVESNQVIGERGWQATTPITIHPRPVKRPMP